MTFVFPLGVNKHHLSKSPEQPPDTNIGNNAFILHRKTKDGSSLEALFNSCDNDGLLTWQTSTRAHILTLASYPVSLNEQPCLWLCGDGGMDR